MDYLLMRNAILNEDFCKYFVRFGGGCSLNSHPLMSHVELADRFSMDDDKFRSLPHRLWPKTSSGDLLEEQALSVMSYAEIQEIRESSRLASSDDLESLMNARGVHKEKVWRFYVGFIHGLPPYHASVNRLLLSGFSRLWFIS